MPIVALTANATGPPTNRTVWPPGMDDYLAKPVRLEAMRQVLERWLVVRGAGAGPERTASPAEAARPAPATASASPAELVARSTPVLDLEMLESLRSLAVGGEDVLGPLVALFLDQAAGQMRSIAAAVKSGDCPSLVGVAHSLKGAARNVGAVLMGEIAWDLERRGRAGSAREPDLSSELAEAFTATRKAFETDLGHSFDAGPGMAAPSEA